MDEDLPSQYLPDHIDSDLTGDNSDMPAACSFCGRTLSPESGINSNLRTGSICGDCKFLLLEDYGNPSLQYHHSRPLRDMDRSSSYHQPTSMHTTPDSSRRWRRVISDAGSDGFISDSFYAESESNVSFSGAYRVSYVDSDAVSFSGYGGDSDVSVDGPAFLDADIFAQSMERSDVDSDSDIDPMHAGVLHWDFDQDYEEYLEQLVENDGLRRGAPPASASFVDSLPLIVISEDHQKKSEGLVCAICKDLLTIGIEVNRLPCLHLYHPPCILPWLSARNSCPLCRYELPTDDIDYELRKRNSNRVIISQIQEHDGRDDSSSVSNDGSETDDGGCEFGGMLRNVGPTRDSSDNGGRRGRWLFLAAAPIASIVGVVFVMWLGNSLSGRVGESRQHPQGTRTSDSGPHNQQVRRRWWF